MEAIRGTSRESFIRDPSRYEEQHLGTYLIKIRTFMDKDAETTLKKNEYTNGQERSYISVSVTSLLIIVSCFTLFKRTPIDSKQPLVFRYLFQIIDTMGLEYTGTAYHPLYRNCNHFSNELCMTLLGEGELISNR